MRVRDSTSTGGLAGVAWCGLNGMVSCHSMAVTDALGEYTFEALEALNAEEATLIVAPPPAGMQRRPRKRSRYT